MSVKSARALLGMGFAGFLFFPATTWAQVAPTLGAAQQFGALGKSAVTGSAGFGTVVSGDVGSYPTPAITNFPPSSVASPFVLHAAADPVVQQAQTDAKAAYDFLAAQGGTPLNDNLSANGIIGPGVYSLGTADLASSTTLTLNGSGIFIFNVASTLTLNASSLVTGSANPCNVYWRVGTSATLNGTSFMGTVIADASITVGGGTVSGRVLAGTGATGAATMSVGGNTIGGCSAALVPPTVAKAFSPTNITAGGISRLTVTLSNSNVSLIALNAVFTDTLPSGVVIAATPTAATTCGGVVTATAGGSSVSLAQAGSTIPSASSCTVAVNVTATAVGSFVNTVAVGALQTTSGNNAAPATATLAAACPVITIAPLTLTAGRVGVAYSRQLTASGGSGVYTFTVASGTLPAGLTLTAGGLLAGTPTATGSSTVTIQASDGNGCPGVMTYVLVMAAAACPVITVAPPTMPAGAVGVAYSQQITASGGAGAYTFTVLSGTLPAGLTLTSGGLLAGTPTTTGSSTVIIQGTDVNGCPDVVTYVIVIAAAACPVITIAPLTLTAGRVGVAYSRQLTASGGSGAYTFTVASGTLPAGLTLTAGGLLAGTPTTTGSSTVTIQASDGNGCPGVMTYVLVMAAAACPVITVAPPTVPAGAVGVAYSQQITASGGAGAYTFTVLSGTLPAGLTLTSGGLLAGTPTTTGSSTVIIQGTDVNGCPDVVTYVIVIAAAPCPVITIAPLTLTAGRLGVAYSRQLTASGGSGAYTFTVASGTLPAGLTLTAGGLLAGTPTTTGSSTVTIQASDGNGCPGVMTYVLVMAAAACPVITVAPPTVPAGAVGVAYSQQITASGGAGAYTFTVLSGTLPAGLTLTSGGLLAGTPTTTGSSTVIIQGTDVNGCPDVVTYVIVIAAAACPVITVAPPTLPVGAVGVAYNQQLTASGGSGSSVFTVLSGALPAGLTLSASGLLSGTPTTLGSSAVTIQATDGAGCPGVSAYTIVVGPAVPTLPQWWMIALSMLLALAGFAAMRSRTR